MNDNTEERLNDNTEERLNDNTEERLNDNTENKLNDIESVNIISNESDSKKEEPKKKNNILLYILFLIVILVSCGALYYFITSNNDNKETDKKEEKIDDTSILFTEETLPRVDASLATQPLMDAFVKNFTGKTTEEMKVEYSNTHPAYVKLINNETDLIIVTEPSAEELELAKQKGIELEVTPVVNEGFVFFVNANNPVNSLKLEEVQKIYTGEITNWKQVGGNDAAIVAFQRPTNSGSQTGLLSLVMKDLKVKVPTSTEEVETMAGIVDIVADYNNGINSIGYSYYYYAETMYKNENVKYIAINGVAPTTETIKDGSYELRSSYYIVTRKGEQNKKVEELKNAMLSSRGQKVAQEAGYVPVK